MQIKIMGHTVEVVVDEDSVASVASACRRIFLGICERIKGLERAIDLARGAKI